MKDDGDPRSTIAFNKAHQTAGVVGVAVTQDHGMQLVAFDFQDIHVVQHAVECHAGIEKKAISVAASHRSTPASRRRARREVAAGCASLAIA